MKTVTEFLRPLKAERLRQLSDGYVERHLSAPTDVTVHAGVTVTPLGQIVGAWRDPAPDLLVEDHDMVSRLSAAAPGAQLVGGKAVWLGYLHDQWGQFLLNTLSRCWHRPADADTYVLAVAQGTPKTPEGNYRTVLEALGLGGKLMVIDAPIGFEELHVPTPSFSLDRWWSPQFRQVFDDVVTSLGVPRVAPGSTGRIWLTRARDNSKYGYELGLGWLERVFTGNGFRAIEPEHMPLKELCRLLRGAETVATVSGSIAHNVLFGRPGTDVWIMDRWPVVNYYQLGIDHVMDNSVTMVDVHVTPKPVLQSRGPFIYCPTPGFKAFAAREGLKVASRGDMRAALRRYYRLHRRLYGRRTPVEEWSIVDGQTMLEAVHDANRFFNLGNLRPDPLWRRVAKRLYHMVIK